MRLPTLFAVAALCLVPVGLHAQRERLPPEDLVIVEARWPGAKRTPTGLRHLIVTEGSGETPRAGDVVKVLYTGRLLDGEKFDENVDRAKPFSFRLGRGQVIVGWDEAIQRMLPGEKAVFIIPSEIAYGARGKPPKIPRNAALVFDIELLEIERAAPLSKPAESGKSG